MASQVAQERIFNFSAGPAVLPVPVLERIRDEMLCLPGAGASIMEISHRSKQFIAIHEQAKARLARLLNVGADHEILFLQGGARLQFSMIPMNLLQGREQPAQYILTGSWGKSALPEAQKVGPVEVLFDGKETNYDRLPDISKLAIKPDASYVHITSNETIQGVQFPADLDTGTAPLVCDSSSDFLYRPYNMDRYGLLYACAQKNAGPAGVTVVILKKELLERSSAELPGYLNYANQAAADSMWNTPPTFAVYVLGLVTEWLEDTVGGLEKMHALNQSKAKVLYDILDQNPELYMGHARKQDRSLMNVTFRFPSEEIEKQFLAGASAAGLENLKGHRSVGGIRASIYNAMPSEGVQALASFMTEFAQKHG
ncbi:3-phosphoserine/phosphohydroxythreonine transaminase [Aureliella helgolandensis]|uniref:Phosphoserine aminotransferase n=1 Tax=Aureliella helgolandensis TaxID=2527968 RepID=A0A518GFZ2_9BACT|nr:3-phosphoserine/phosphohydroxythreonine transaminase [Aureliella helgolandensis]QDV27467.1 Phosphoserine aminotransferase [Aureliella helgolandensis]